MTEREAEEAALSKGELSDLNAALAKFEAGEIGFYGDRDNPGLLPRLEGIQKFWDIVRLFQADAYESNGWFTTIRLPQRQLVELDRYFGQELANADDKFRELAERNPTLPEINNFQLRIAFLQNLKKATTKAIQLAQDERAKQILGK